MSFYAALSERERENLLASCLTRRDSYILQNTRVFSKFRDICRQSSRRNCRNCCVCNILISYLAIVKFSMISSHKISNSTVLDFFFLDRNQTREKRHSINHAVIVTNLLQCYYQKSLIPNERRITFKRLNTIRFTLKRCS